jgi:hypothetical protein
MMFCWIHPSSTFPPIHYPALAVIHLPLLSTCRGVPFPPTSLWQRINIRCRFACILCCASSTANRSKYFLCVWWLFRSKGNEKSKVSETWLISLISLRWMGVGCSQVLQFWCVARDIRGFQSWGKLTCLPVGKLPCTFFLTNINSQLLQYKFKASWNQRKKWA